MTKSVYLFTPSSPEQLGNRMCLWIKEATITAVRNIQTSTGPSANPFIHNELTQRQARFSEFALSSAW